MREIVFSDSAIQANLEGEVTVKFIVDEKGVPGDISIVKGMGYGIDEEVVRLAPQLKYFPARIGDLPIKMEQLITIPLRAYRKQ
jgi:TonB family protein